NFIHRFLSSSGSRNNNGNNGISVSIAKLQCTDWNCCCCSWRSGFESGVVAFPSDFKQRERRRASMQDAIDASKINADLYSKLYNQASTTIRAFKRRISRQLNFSLEFREETGILSIRIIQAIDCSRRTAAQAGQPYCAWRCCRTGKTQTTTKIHKRTPEPEFEEEFIFELKPQDINWSGVGDYRVDYDPCSMDEFAWSGEAATC
uniref:C2 domain-containing protein n=1 Tax=Macrostomum lignano TaxID=282301 RepID=A0A1I8FR30_9PLAT